MDYRGYELEKKMLMVGWKITITKVGKFVRNGSVSQKLYTAADEAHKIVDDIIASAEAPSLPAGS